MPRVSWSLTHGRPIVQVVLTEAQGGLKVVKNILADSGAGSLHSPFELILDEQDCVLCGGRPRSSVQRGGAYVGVFPRYSVRVEVPQLQFRRTVAAIGIANVPSGFDGIACFRFLNRFTYGNFGSPLEFGLEL